MRKCTTGRLDKVPPSGIRRFFDLVAGMEGVISMGVGEPDFSTPWNITEAAIRSLEQGFTMYTSNAGMPELRQELAAYLKRTYGLEYDPNTELLITNGVSEGLDLAARAILDPGDEVIMPDPGYVAYPAAVLLADGVPVQVPTHCENGFRLSANDVRDAVTSRTKAILIGYPANPTGAVMEMDKLAEIADVAEKRRLLVISDEIYSLLVYDMQPACFACLPGMKDHTILLGGFSKAFAMTGWRIGYAAARREIIAGMTKIHQYTALSSPTMGQVAAIEALRSGEAEAQKMIDEYDRRRRVIVKGLNDIGLSCFEPKGAFYAFPSIKSTGMTSEEFAENLLMEEKVAVVHGNAFGPSGEGHVRCCYATSMPNIEEALTRMARFVQRHRSV
ncbi:MAG TPA: aminotransferase class I/II-fold pyridoxal phosphate-dependent enzyme [Dehalococcoidia bacterium]|nr:aminotransferase class I/II-fold pyridoxal phosphate-dependent enzyme [Dehalococcoidia bacterium]